MNYPEHIYSKFEIVEKEIFGEIHYGLVKTYNILGLEFRLHKKVHVSPFDYSIGRIESSGSRWTSSFTAIKSAIEWDNTSKEYKFRKKVTK